MVRVIGIVSAAALLGGCLAGENPTAIVINAMREAELGGEIGECTTGNQSRVIFRGAFDIAPYTVASSGLGAVYPGHIEIESKISTGDENPAADIVVLEKFEIGTKYLGPIGSGPTAADFPAILQAVDLFGRRDELVQAVLEPGVPTNILGLPLMNEPFIRAVAVDPNVGSATHLFQVDVRAVGRRQTQRVESNLFHYPIEVCFACLTVDPALVGACPAPCSDPTCPATFCDGNGDCPCPVDEKGAFGAGDCVDLCDGVPASVGDACTGAPANEPLLCCNDGGMLRCPDPCAREAAEGS